MPLLLFYMPHAQIHLFLYFSAIESLLIYSSLTDFDRFQAQHCQPNFPNQDPLPWERSSSHMEIKRRRGLSEKGRFA